MPNRTFNSASRHKIELSIVVTRKITNWKSVGGLVLYSGWMNRIHWKIILIYLPLIMFHICSWGIVTMTLQFLRGFQFYSLYSVLLLILPTHIFIPTKKLIWRFPGVWRQLCDEGVPKEWRLASSCCTCNGKISDNNER